MADSKISFKWGNVTRPTPANLSMWAASARRIVAVVAGFSIIMDANKWVPFIVLMIGAVLDELKNFFAYAAEHGQEAVVVTYPSELADKIEVKTEVVSAEEPKKVE